MKVTGQAVVQGLGGGGTRPGITHAGKENTAVTRVTVTDGAGAPGTSSVDTWGW